MGYECTDCTFVAITAKALRIHATVNHTSIPPIHPSSATLTNSTAQSDPTTILPSFSTYQEQSSPTNQLSHPPLIPNFSQEICQTQPQTVSQSNSNAFSYTQSDLLKAINLAYIPELSVFVCQTCRFLVIGDAKSHVIKHHFSDKGIEILNEYHVDLKKIPMPSINIQKRVPFVDVQEGHGCPVCSFSSSNMEIWLAHKRANPEHGLNGGPFDVKIQKLSRKPEFNSFIRVHGNEDQGFSDVCDDTRKSHLKRLMGDVAVGLEQGVLGTLVVEYEVGDSLSRLYNLNGVSVLSKGILLKCSRGPLEDDLFSIFFVKEVVAAFYQRIKEATTKLPSKTLQYRFINIGI